jgi:hypothetical protein
MTSNTSLMAAPPERSTSLMMSAIAAPHLRMHGLIRD